MHAFHDKSKVSEEISRFTSLNGKYINILQVPSDIIFMAITKSTNVAEVQTIYTANFTKPNFDF